MKHINNCVICKDNKANLEYFKKYKVWSPFLSTVAICKVKK